ncbi:MAG: hypothetical protein NT018_00955 [Armatimonadetes bacterium]|nr:hypothetical protein [Armatimonadota bacterium]
MTDSTRKQAFEVYAYSSSKLIQILSDCSMASVDVVHDKPHSDYFYEYFGSSGVNAKTILVEHNYIDRDFLEDYSSYYVRCFFDYNSICTRLHFFDEFFTRDNFTKLLRGCRGKRFVEKLRNAYLGFIVVKPLPETIIGRTCLKTYLPDNDRRHFPITRPYKANIFGVKLEIADTLAFQEQDSVAAACATSALWSTFQGTGRQFQHAIPSPVEITKAAHARFPLDERELPNFGLRKEQMAHAISSVGLQPLHVKINDTISNEYCLQSTIYGYLKGGIPVPLIVMLYDHSAQTKRGLHAVAVTGYSLGKTSPDSYGQSDFLLRASRIDKLYAHDDGVGPFARMEIDTIMVNLIDPDTGSVMIDQSTGYPLQTDYPRLKTSWRNQCGKIGDTYAKPEYLLIPLYHKIRIPYRTAMNVVIGFDEFMKLPIVAQSLKLFDVIEWDIYLTEVNKLKREILESPVLSGDYKKAVLLECMPKYVWRATAEMDGKRVLDLILDATDIEQGPLMVRAIEYDPNIGHVLRVCTKVRSIIAHYELRPVRNVLHWFAEQPVS